MAIDWEIVKKIVEAYCEAHPEVDKKAALRKLRKSQKRGY